MAGAAGRCARRRDPLGCGVRQHTEGGTHALEFHPHRRRRSSSRPRRTSTTGASSAGPSTPTSRARRGSIPTPSCRTACPAPRRGVIRGLHIRVGRGREQAGALLLRPACSTSSSTCGPGSPTYREWLSVRPRRRQAELGLHPRRVRPRLPGADRAGRHGVPDRPAARPARGPDHRSRRPRARHPLAPPRQRHVTTPTPPRCPLAQLSTALDSIRALVRPSEQPSG